MFPVLWHSWFGKSNELVQWAEGVAAGHCGRVWVMVCCVAEEHMQQ